MRRLLSSVLLISIVTGLAVLGAQTPGALRIVTVAPVGEIRQHQDANEIRVVFSEPMIALGSAPATAAPPWIRLTPAPRGTWRWSGTTILIFTPDPATPLPHATRYRITVDAGAASAAGQRLGAPFTSEFVTPTVRMQAVRWARRNGRFDQPVTLALQFNQRVRPADVVAHTTARFRTHQFTSPTLTAAERARMARLDPAGLARYDAKLTAARQASARTDPVPLRLATTWDRERFPPSETMVVLETTTAPPPGTHMSVTLDATMPSPEGPERPPSPQTTLVENDPVFFVMNLACRTSCDPSSYNAVEFSGQVEAAVFARALSVRDITDPANEQPVTPTARVPAAGTDASSHHNVEDGGFERQPPARTWALRLDPALQAIDGQTLGYPWIGLVDNWHERAFFSFGDGHGVWEAGGGTTLPFYARNFRTMTQFLAPLTRRDLMPRILTLQRDGFQGRPPGAGTLRRLNLRDDAIQSHGLDVSSQLSTAGRGLVWAAIEPGEVIPRSRRPTRTRSTIVQVTNLGITVKDSPQSTLVFVTALDTGQPVTDARVSIVNTANEDVWRGSTNRDGVALAPALRLRDPNNWYELSFLVTAEKDGDLAYVVSDWNEGISPWDFGHSYGLWEATEILRGSIFTDRGVYKPGEEVKVKTIARLDTPTGIRLMPNGSTLDVRVVDARDREVDRRQIKLNRWSSAEWSWTVPAESTLGMYRIQTSVPGSQPVESNDATPRQRRTASWLKQLNGSFTVAAYRRPDFRVDTTLTAQPAVAGATMRATVDARYLFGNAMARRPVTWSLRRNVAWEIPAPILERFPRDKYAFGYFPQRTGPADDRTAGDAATLDASGRLSLDLTAEAGTDLAWQYTFEGDVEDVSRQHMANRSSLVVHSAPWHIGVRRPAYFADVAAGTNVDIVAVGADGRLVAGVPVKVSLVRVQWNSVRRAEGSGFYTWETERIEQRAGEWTVTTTDAPVALRIPLTEGGSYQLKAEAAHDGFRARTDVSFYALGAGYTAWQRFDHNRITIEPERKTWKPGERARIMIQSPWESATALLTVEREGIRHYERFALTSTQQTVEVPITEKDIPNLYVSVLLIRGRTSQDPGADGSDPGKPAFRLGYTEIAVEDATKRLTVEVTADREEYRPATRARVSVAVTDAAARPVRGEVTLWAVDYGVLSLTGYQSPDVQRAVYQDKALQVMNMDSRQRLISRRVLTPKGDTEGGGGGGEVNVRRDFRPLAFWLGSVETNGSGRASRTVTLPESLTTYRIMAIAGDAASRFGSDDAEIRVSKPVTLLPAFPRFLALGDRATFGGVVTNTLPAGGDATVTIRSLDPSIIEIQDAASRGLPLPGGGTEPVRFDAIARTTGTARIQMVVRLGDQSDAFETTIPVIAPSRPEVVAAFGDTTDRAVERLAIPAGVLPARGGLEVALASTALVGLGEGARYLADYPYGCAEQKASAALALVLAADLGEAFSMGRIAPAEYRQRATSLLGELPRFQCADGGFGSWPGCLNGHTYLTAYVLHVMHVASGLGFTRDDAVTGRALDFLQRELQRPAPQQIQWIPVWSASNAFGVKVLVDYGRNQDSNITRLYSAVDRLPIFALSYLADAIAGARRGDPRYAEVIRRLTNAMRVEGDRAFVQEIDEDILQWIWNSNVRATAVVLEGLVRRGDDPVMIARAVRWLLGARQKGRWRNTQENGTALEALVRYYRTFEAEPPDMRATVSVGARSVGTARFRGRSTTTQNVRLEMPDLLRQVAAGAEADLAIARTGTGRLYYTARLQYVPATPPAAIDQGMRIERRYERYVENGSSPAATTFEAGDLIRVTLAITLPKESRYVAVTDSLPGGVEAVDGWFRTTAADLARDASQQSSDESWEARWRRGGFDRVEKYDDRVQLFATRLSQGRHEFSYLVRATTAGTFSAAGTWAEEMYAPEVHGRAAMTTLIVR